MTASANSSSSVPTSFGPGQGETSYGAYNSFVTVKKSAITFESANAAKGPQTLTSSSNVNLTIKNTSPATVTPQVHSQITPAGLGFYLANTATCSPGFGTCAQATGSGINFAHLNIGNSNVVTLANFDFSIATGDSMVYEAKGAVGLQSDAFGAVTTWQTFNSTAFDLMDFGVEVGTGSAFGYNWGATDVDLSLPVELATGQSATVSYNTVVQSYSPTLCIGSSSICLVSYSGFGDPIGRGGGVDSLALINTSSIHSFSSPLIEGLQFDDFTMYANYANGVLDTTTPPGGVPEPAVWTSMLLGFGLLGAALRRRRGLATA
ncbi:MAG: PEP-CTERM sorting domain-containing protein [Caulobacterales bacterium]|nr:PEP-CTERM sorting domain-containing protein [Caulobacterales bacterium]